MSELSVRITPLAQPARETLEIAAAVAAVTAVGAAGHIGATTVGHLYLLVLIVLSMRVSLWPFLGGAVAAGLVWNFVFVPPHLAFSRINAEDATLLAAYLTMALVGRRLALLRAKADRELLLEESERLHHALLDNVSHELKTPVSVLRTAVEQLGVPEGGREGHLFAEIRHATARLERLVHNLLNQTRLEAGILRPKMDWCNLHEVVVEARRACADRLEGRPVEIRVPEDMPLVFADEPMTEQVISNLLINSAIHTPAGGRIQVDACVDAAAGEVRLSVTDEGPGIDPQLAGVVFERFQGGRTERKTGLGLGLSIVKGFIEAQGGRALVESPREGGARFVVTLPLRTPPALDL